MPFSLTNAPVVFQHMMNEMFREHVEDFLVIYIDDILIFFKNEEEHEKHVRLVLEKLRKRGLYVKLEKCLFHQTEMEFFGSIATTEGLKMDTKKLKTIVSSEAPKTDKDIQCFFHFANYYRIFIKNYSQIGAALTRLTSKDKLE